MFLCRLRMLALLSFTGCFHVGLPEHFSSGPTLGTAGGLNIAYDNHYSTGLRASLNSRLPRAVLISPGPAADDAFSTIGHQYLFGLIPFTALYLQHGTESLLDELATDVLLENGYQVVAMPAASEGLLLSALAPAFVLDLKLSALRINGYDAFFFRMLDLTGILDVRIRSLSHGRIGREIRAPFSESEYRKYAHAPLLANLLERTLRKHVTAAIAERPSTRAIQFPPAGASQSVGPDNAPVFALLFPVFENPPPVGMGKFLADSYGYESVLPLTNHALLRIIQRGMEHALSKAQQRFAAFRGGGDQQTAALLLAAAVSGMSVIDVQLLSIEAREGPQNAVALALRITSRSASASHEAVCEVVEPQAEHVDGARIVTLERAAKHVLEAFQGIAENVPGGETRCSTAMRTGS